VNKRAMRAERNRQSAAASRERKKHHIKELERRVSMLSAENAQLQVGQLDTFRQRIAKERELARENRDLRKKVVIQDMTIHDLSRKLKEANVTESQADGPLKRPATWSPAEWGSTNSTAKFAAWPKPEPSAVAAVGATAANGSGSNGNGNVRAAPPAGQREST
jgi:bZIP transcription factor